MTAFMIWFLISRAIIVGFGSYVMVYVKKTGDGDASKIVTATFNLCFLLEIALFFIAPFLFGYTFFKGVEKGMYYFGLGIEKIVEYFLNNEEE